MYVAVTYGETFETRAEAEQAATAKSDELGGQRVGVFVCVGEVGSLGGADSNEDAADKVDDNNEKVTPQQGEAQS